MKYGFSIIGCGRVGCALARYLSMAGYRPAGFYSRHTASARRAALFAGAGEKAADDIKSAAADADIIFITTPDAFIADVAEELAGHGGIRRGAVVLHCSGALPSTILDCIKTLGADTAALHPLQSFASNDIAPSPFEGIMMAVEGSPAAVETAKEIARDLGGIPFEIRTEGKILYHAAAVLASNYLVALMDAALCLMNCAGVDESRAFSILKPLISGTLANIEETGPVKALTGPIARGDVATVERHVGDIQKKVPDILPLYRHLGGYAIKIALRKGTITEEEALRLAEVLSIDRK